MCLLTQYTFHNIQIQHISKHDYLVDFKINLPYFQMAALISTESILLKSKHFN